MTPKKQKAIKKLTNLIYYLKDKNTFNITQECDKFNIGPPTSVALKKLRYVMAAGPSKGDGSKFNNRKKITKDNINKICLSVLNETNRISKNYGKSPYIPIK